MLSVNHTGKPGCSILVERPKHTVSGSRACSPRDHLTNEYAVQTLRHNNVSLSNTPLKSRMPAAVASHTGSFIRGVQEIEANIKQCIHVFIHALAENKCDHLSLIPRRQLYLFPELISVFESINLLPLEKQKVFLCLFADQVKEDIHVSKVPPTVKPLYELTCIRQINRPQSEIELQEEVSCHEVFDHFQLSELWRFVIDRYDQPLLGKFGYENEPGYLNSMFIAFRLMLQQQRKKTPVDSECLLSLHAAATTGLTIILGEQKTKTIPNAFLGGRSGLMIQAGGVSTGYPCSLSISGFAEIKACSTKTSEDRYLEGYNNFDRVISLRNECYTTLEIHHVRGNTFTVEHKYQTTQFDEPKKIQSQINKVMSEYYSRVRDSERNEDKVANVAFCISTLARLHPFRDCNDRVIVFLLTNRLLMDEGLQPVIWNNCKKVLGFSQLEIQNEIIESQKLFAKYCLKPGLDVHAAASKPGGCLQRMFRMARHLVARQVPKQD